LTLITSHLKVMPYLFYEELGEAIDWLVAAFGCSERFRLTLPNGAVLHAEIQFEDFAIMLGNVGPRNQDRPDSVRSSVYVFVDDIEAHSAHAREAGAEIVEEPEEQPFGDRIYLAKDLEGHEWYFAQHLHDVSVEELAKRMGG
jgi:uncharacterized glyoxalase superfamily protein PhnB